MAVSRERIKMYTYRCRKHFKQLDGGNCGVFALGLARYIKKEMPEVEVTLGVLSESVGEVEDFIKTALYSDIDIYHVVVIIEEHMYDGRGEIKVEELLELAESQYSDDSPTLYCLSDIGSERTRRIIEGNTNYNGFNWSDIYRYLTKIYKDKNNRSV